ncbi:Uncharacterized protein BM_BM17480 [Brugia malayi]|uniref:Uncharacterized protein n=1 Tax=Brugia malayi TaxID=6279 RepID=A0A4E9FA53_BRUMA|nr:Uncharacterized protein BM_BM17480 [Brugia malayi]VIO93241.1 Uncharacterized protein BM_BM17480 [Brugia malayi]
MAMIIRLFRPMMDAKVHEKDERRTSKNGRKEEEEERKKEERGRKNDSLKEIEKDVKYKRKKALEVFSYFNSLL